MVDPFQALTVAVVLLGVLLALFWPARGLYWRWRRMSRTTERVLVEDALKHLYDMDYRHQTASAQSMAGALSVPVDRCVDLLARMVTLGLSRMDGTEIRLTPEGRTQALRVIRVHRLWERHLADETGMDETLWHRHAEVYEHRLSVDEVEALAERMGHPRYDPHGDPIPTSTGDLPPAHGKPLTTLSEGELGGIVHLEDEPETVYAQLVAARLYPGMRIQVLEASPSRIRFWADGDEHVLAPVFAANVTVVPLPEEVEPEGPRETLAALRPGERGRVLHIARACRAQQRRRLLDLGILPGTRIAAELTGAGGEPTAYRVRGTLIALREEQAQLVYIEREAG